jgi:hypothetical protein
MKLDSRQFSQKAYEALVGLKESPDESYRLEERHYKKASGLVQGLPAYISTWGLHRLSGDAKKFLNPRSTEDTKYKGKVYRTFLIRLKEFSGQKFDPEDEGSLVNLSPLREYTALNHLAIRLAKEWSFWAGAVLGEAEE